MGGSRALRVCRWGAAVLVGCVTALTGCGDDGSTTEQGGTTGPGSSAATTAETTTGDRSRTTSTGSASASPAPGSSPSTSPPSSSPPLTRPDWLGTRVLDPDAPPPPTPPELDPRALPTIDHLPPPADGRFHSTVEAVPPDVAARSTWRDECPVALGDLRYVTVSFRGFDGSAHTGELLVHVDAAEAVAGAFGELFAAGFPIEDMRVATMADLEAPDTGDGNPTTAFVCRPTRNQTSWSEHAYGLAVDVNPFQNPYTRDDGSLLPGLASTYLDRGDVRPGMIVAGDATVRAFAAIGWAWGGDWSSPRDYMHFSASGR